MGSPPSSERGGTKLQSWRRGTVSPLSERSNGYTSPASMRGTPPLSPEKREVSPASERGTPKLWSRGAAEPSCNNSETVESRVGSPPSSERGFVSLLGRRGKQTLSPLPAARSTISSPSSPLSPVEKSKHIHSPSVVTLSPGKPGRPRNSG